MNKQTDWEKLTTVRVKYIWIVCFESYTDWVAADNLEEALSYFTEKAHKTIVKIEKTDNKITYQY